MCSSDLLAVAAADEVMIMTQGGMAVRIAVAEIPQIGRDTQGVRCMRLNPEDRVVAASKVVSEDEGPAQAGPGPQDADPPAPAGPEEGEQP